MTTPERPLDVLKRSAERMAAQRQAIKDESARIAEERATATPTASPEQPATK